MAGNTATLVVKIIGDSTGATRALAQVDAATGRTADATAKGGKKMAGVWAGVGAAMLGCVKASSMTESAVNALNVVFGSQSAEMVEWAEGMASYGLSTAQAGAAAAVLGAQLKNAGFTAEQMTVITQGLVETSAQLANVMGVDTVTAVQAMGAALRGEYDSLEQLGITLTADAVATEVMRLTQEGATFATEQQAKAVATLSLIQQGATTILGDAEEQTVTMKTATEYLKSSTLNLASAIGDTLTPVLTPLIQGLAVTIDKLGGAISESELLQDVSNALAEVLGMLAEILSPIVSEALQFVAECCQVLYDLLAPFVVPIVNALAWALDLVADALAVVIDWVNKAIDAFERFVEIVAEAVDTLTFWNDTYSGSSPSSAAYGYSSPVSRSRVSPFGNAAAAAGNIHVYTMYSDPHSLARFIRRILREDASRLGSAA